MKRFLSKNLAVAVLLSISLAASAQNSVEDGQIEDYVSAFPSGTTTVWDAVDYASNNWDPETGLLISATFPFVDDQGRSWVLGANLAGNQFNLYSSNAAWELVEWKGGGPLTADQITLLRDTAEARRFQNANPNAAPQAIGDVVDVAQLIVDLISLALQIQEAQSQSAWEREQQLQEQRMCYSSMARDDAAARLAANLSCPRTSYRDSQGRMCTKYANFSDRNFEHCQGAMFVSCSTQCN